MHLGYVHTFLSMLHKIKGIYFFTERAKKKHQFHAMQHIET